MWTSAWSTRQGRRAPCGAGSRSWPWKLRDGARLRDVSAGGGKKPPHPVLLPPGGKERCCTLQLRNQGSLGDGLAFFRGACDQRRAVGAYVRALRTGACPDL